MNEKDKQKLAELKMLIKADCASETDKTEYALLKEKQETADAIKQAMSEYLKDVPALKALSSMHVRAGDAGPASPAGSVENFGTLLRGIKRGDMELIKTASPMTEGTSADGGYLVPALTEATILEAIPTFGQARKYMQVMPMSGNTLN